MIDKSLDFYNRLLGIERLRDKEYPKGRFSLAFVGCDPELINAVVEITHKWNQEKTYDDENIYGHLAVAVDDVYKIELLDLKTVTA